MRSWLVVSVVVGMVSAVASGCSGNSGPTDLTAFCEQKAQIECSYVTNVCENLAVATCESYRSNLCVQDGTTATMNNYRSYNANNAQACFAQLNNAYGTLKIPVTTLEYSAISGPLGDQNTVDYQCETVFTGNVAQNSGCRTNYDCSSSSDVCAPAVFGKSALVCAPITNVGDNDPCEDPGDVCPSSDSCQASESGEALCEPSTASAGGGLNDPCKTDADCNPSVAGFCDIYNGSTCQTAYFFGLGYDCEAFGGTAPK